jgi:hypothetical protein
VEHVLKVLSKCYMPQASFTPYLLSQTSDRLEGWYLGHVTESQDTDCTQTHYIVIVHCAHCISLYSLCKPTLQISSPRHHVTMSHAVNIVTCRMSGEHGSGMLWDALASRPALVVPESTWLQGRGTTGPKTTEGSANCSKRRKIGVELRSWRFLWIVGQSWLFIADCNMFPGGKRDQLKYVKIVKGCDIMWPELKSLL